MEISLEMVLDAIGMTTEDTRMDEDGKIYIPLSKALTLWLKNDEDECDCCDCDCDCDCNDDCDCDCCCDDDENCDCDCDECEDDFEVPNLVELAQTYGVEILVNERNRAKELNQHEAYDALNFAVDVLLHQNALDVEWLADTYDNVVD